MILFALYVCGLDDRPPLRNLVALVGGKRLGGLLLKRWCLLTNVGKSLQGYLVSQRFPYSCAELGRNVHRGVARRPNRMPVDEIESGQARFVHSWDLRCGRKAALGRHRKSLDSGRADLRHRK